MERKTREEVEKEIVALKDIKPKVRRTTFFGDDNHLAIEAQIEVLEIGLDDNDIYDREESGEWTENQRESATQALDWLEGRSDYSLVEDWKELVRK